MNRKQFILTANNKGVKHFKNVNKIGKYNLQLGQESTYAFVKKANNELHLAGSMFDWQFPKLSNEQILEKLSSEENLSDTIKATNQFTGTWILIAVFGGDIYIFNDAAAQQEVYYSDCFSCFATQPKLICQFIKCNEHISYQAKEFYTSKTFIDRKTFIGTSTPWENILHLKPNHFLDVKAEKVKRFFPIAPIVINGIEEAAILSVKMLRGYMLSLAERNKLKVGVTAGYDSRVLFLATLGLDCEYYVSQLKSMPKDHPDLVISEQLTSLFNKELVIETPSDNKISDWHVEYINDIDFPLCQVDRSNSKSTYINGNISEIARDFYGSINNVNAKDLSYLLGYKNSKFVENSIKNFLKNKNMFRSFGLHFLDMFYWEENMGNWAAKTKTEAVALGYDIISPFNSRDLLCLLLSTKRSFRDSHNNKLYNRIIEILSEKHDGIRVGEISINPSKMKDRIITLKKLKLYKIYMWLNIKLRRLDV